MKFLADENIPLEVVEYLRQQGVDIVSLSSIEPGLEDEAILRLAIKEKRTLVTFDVDFSALIFKFKKESCGVIFLRIYPQSVESIISILKKVLEINIVFEKSFCVAELHRIRVVPLQ